MHWKTCFTTVVALTSMVVPVLPGGAVASPASSAQHRVGPVSPVALELRIDQLRSQGLPEAEVRTAVEKEFGVDWVAGSAPASEGIEPAAATGEDVVLGKPDLFWETAGQHFMVIAKFHWKRTCGGGHNLPCWTEDNRRHGGPDGMGLSINAPIARIEAALELFTNCSAATLRHQVLMQPATENEHGVGFQGQDSETLSAIKSLCASADAEYTWDNGWLWETFQFQRPDCSGTPLVHVVTKFTHTWGQTSVTGIGIGADYVNFSWSSADARFEVNGASPLLMNCSDIRGHL